jgi:hypothetical protein
MSSHVIRKYVYSRMCMDYGHPGICTPGDGRQEYPLGGTFILPPDKVIVKMIMMMMAGRGEMQLNILTAVRAWYSHRPSVNLCFFPLKPIYFRVTVPHS